MQTARFTLGQPMPVLPVELAQDERIAPVTADALTVIQLGISELLDGMKRAIVAVSFEAAGAQGGASPPVGLEGFSFGERLEVALLEAEGIEGLVSDVRGDFALYLSDAQLARLSEINSDVRSVIDPMPFAIMEPIRVEHEDAALARVDNMMRPLEGALEEMRVLISGGVEPAVRDSSILFVAAALGLSVLGIWALS